MRLYHDSRSLDCRSPFGAVRCGDTIRLRFYCEGEAVSVNAILISGEHRFTLPMVFSGDNGYDLRFQAPEKPCSVDYFFAAVGRDGQTNYLGNAEDGLGGVGLQTTSAPLPFTITVYDRDFDTPDFMKDGILYQIFPDRFHRSRVPQEVQPGAYLHKDWDEPVLTVRDPRCGYACADFYGGDLKGIIEKLDYLESLHVTVLYLNPIFMARSNHRYDTSDYRRIDPLVGTEEDLKELCREAEKRGMHVLLDGVFSHTGDDSVYFNRYGHFDSVGAYQSPDSPYASWYTFERYPDKYKCWWDFITLPTCRKQDPAFREFMLGQDGVVPHYPALGTAGWRLDVADELPMDFLRQMRTSLPKGKVLLGEVWEDASNKISYGERRNYCLGDTLDSVMNYPLRAAALAFIKGEITAFDFARRVDSLRENYPRPFFYALMNLMGSHDRERVLNLLADETWTHVPEKKRAMQKLPPEKRKLAIKRLKEMWRLYIALPGMPSLYYGDEAGVEGAADPFCRAPYPWGHEDTELLTFVRQMLDLRASRPVLRRGEVELTPIDNDTLRIRRFGYAGFDVFGEDMQDEDYEVIVRSVRA